MLNLELKPETLKRLTRSAEVAGKSINEYIDDVFSKLPDELEKIQNSRTGADLLKELKSLNLSPQYGDMSLTPIEYSEKIRTESNRLRYA